MDKRRGRTVTGANVGTPRKRCVRYMGTVARVPQFAEVIDRPSRTNPVVRGGGTGSRRYAASGMGARGITRNASKVTSATTAPAM